MKHPYSKPGNPMYMSWGEFLKIELIWVCLIFIYLMFLKLVSYIINWF